MKKFMEKEKKYYLISKEDLEKKIINETENIQERILTEYDAFIAYKERHLENKDLKDNVKGFISFRMFGVYTYSQKANKIFNLEKLFSYMGIDITDYSNELAGEKDLSKAFCTLDYIKNVQMMNPADKFIVLFYFWGIKDTRDKALRELKIRDVDLIKKVINVNGKEISIADKDILKIVNDTLITNVYITAKGVQPKKCSLSDNSPYVLRVKRTENTEDGCSPLSYNAVRVRLQKVNMELGTNFSKNSLKLSGIAHQLFTDNSTPGYWDLTKIKEWKKKVYKSTFAEGDVLNILNELYY